MNRFAYTLNNPVRYIDPSGHMGQEPSGGTGGGEEEEDDDDNDDDDEYVITTENVDEFPNPANTPSSQYPNGKKCWPKCNKEANGGVEIPSEYFKATSSNVDEEKGAAPIGGGGGVTTGGNERVPGMGTGGCAGISQADCTRLTSGFGNTTSGRTNSTDALNAAEKWLRKNPKEVDSGVFQSTEFPERWFRMTERDLGDFRQGPHVHFEIKGPNGQAIENGHLYLDEVILPWGY